MALGKIDHIDLSVTDLEKAEKYFTEKLGFKLLRRIEQAGKEIRSLQASCTPVQAYICY